MPNKYCSSLLPVILLLAGISATAQNSIKPKYTNSIVYTGIEVGSKGVKMSVIEIGKNAIAQLKVDSDNMLKQQDLYNKQRESENKRQLETKKIEAQKEAERLRANIEKEKLQLEEKKLKAAKELRAMMDKAAMEREQLKAKTAIKNRVVGERKSSK